jgi:1-acyl-sn-glycerol-3-phosphate acyltransferase
MIRGAFALGVIIIVIFLVGDLVQRTLIVGLVSIFPGSRTRILTVWQGLLVKASLGLVRMGGARYGELPHIPCDKDVLVLMNHQSFLDIPLVLASVRGGYPLIVTRARYTKGKPTLSKLLRMYQYPTVGSGATLEEELARIKGQAKSTDRTIVIYPEGHRTRDGEISRFKKAGLKALLSVKRWQVYLIVGDGFWQCAKLKEFVMKVPTVRGSLRTLGPFTSPDSEEEFSPFINDMRDRMIAELREMRGEAPEA